MTNRVALVTEDRFIDARAAAAADVPTQYYANIEQEDALLSEALKRLGASPVRVSWQDKSLHWENFDFALIRTTWNYFIEFAAFTDWLTRTEHRTTVLNPPSLLRWNWDKRYLRELDQKGVRVVETRFLEPGRPIDFADELDTRPDHELIIKPSVSGGARHTYRMTKTNRLEVERELAPLRDHTTFLLQDVQRSILNRGEVSLMHFGGELTHSVRKVAKPGDFRVQDDHGGTMVGYQPTEAEKKLAQQTLRALPIYAHYARIDIADDNGGAPTVIEAELIEPELFLRIYPPAADAFASAVLEDQSV